MNDEKNQNGETNLEFSFIFYQVPIVIFLTFMYYNIIMLCYIHHIWMIIWLCISNHFIMKKKNVVYFRYDVKNGQLFKYSIKV